MVSLYTFCSLCVSLQSSGGQPDQCGGERSLSGPPAARKTVSTSESSCVCVCVWTLWTSNTWLQTGDWPTFAKRTHTNSPRPSVSARTKAGVNSLSERRTLAHLRVFVRLRRWIDGGAGSRASMFLLRKVSVTRERRNKWRHLFCAQRDFVGIFFPFFRYFFTALRAFLAMKLQLLPSASQERS